MEQSAARRADFATKSPVAVFPTRLGSFGQYVSKLVLTVSIWVFVVGLAIFAFPGSKPSNQVGILPKEWYGFGCAFSIAGTITGVVVLMTFREWRRAIGFAVTCGVLLAGSILALRWFIFRWTAPNVGWAASEWNQAVERLGLGLSLGVGIALVSSILVVLAGSLARRVSSWRFGIAIAIAAAVLGLWGFPLLIWQFMDHATTYLHWHYGHRFDEVLRGAAAGGGPGALAGAIATGLVTWWLQSWSGFERGVVGAKHRS